MAAPSRRLPPRRASINVAPEQGTSSVRKHLERSKFTMNVSRASKDLSMNFLFTTGVGNFGQLGLGVHYLETKRPMWVKMDYDIIDIHAGAFHSVCLTDKGEVLTFGNNECGALGRATGEENAEFTPGPVLLPSKAKQITAGEYHTVALLENGCVYAWGNFKDSYGMMGLTLDGQQNTPVLVFSNHPVVKIASGSNHFVVLTKEGDVYTMGCSEQGQLGRIPQRNANRHCRKAFDKQLALFTVYSKPSQKTRFDNIWAGGNSTITKAIDSNEIYVFGCNTYKQLGTNTTDMIYAPTLSADFTQYDWRNIKCDEYHTMGIDFDGKVYVIGFHDKGRLGLGESTESVNTLTEVIGLNKYQIFEIGIGYATCFAAPEETGLVAWGDGSSGQLGTGDDAARWLPSFVASRALDNKRMLKISGGAKHTMILAYHIDRTHDV